MDLFHVIVFLILGLVAGTSSGLLGIGGGVILVPLLVYGFGLSEHLAQGTTLALMVPPIGLLAAWDYYRKGQVQLKTAAWVCVGFLFGGLIGAQVADSMSNAVLSSVFGLFLALIAAKVLSDSIWGKRSLSAPHARRNLGRAEVPVYLLLGLGAGSMSGLLGIGGGVVIVPALVYVCGFSQHEAQGTTLALMVPPIGLLAAMSYYHQGFVDVHIAALACVGFFLGALLGSRLAGRLSGSVLGIVFGIAMLAIAVKMFVGA